MYNHNSGGGFLKSLPPCTKNILIINVGLWLVCSFIPGFGGKIIDLMGLHYWAGSDFNPVQIFTYMFLQAPAERGMTGFGHIFFNMFALYMFGRILEATWGSRRFLLFYFVCGVGAALLQETVWAFTAHTEWIDALAVQNGTSADSIRQAIAFDPAAAQAGYGAFKNALLTIGASGAIFGLLLGFACVFPNVPMYLFFVPVPIKAKWLVLGYAVLEFVFGITGTQSMVAHFAHLGGMLFGIPLILYWKQKGTLHGRGF